MMVEMFDFVMTREEYEKDMARFAEMWEQMTDYDREDYEDFEDFIDSMFHQELYPES